MIPTLFCSLEFSELTWAMKKKEQGALPFLFYLFNSVFGSFLNDHGVRV